MSRKDARRVLRVRLTPAQVARLRGIAADSRGRRMTDALRVATVGALAGLAPLKPVAEAPGRVLSLQLPRAVRADLDLRAARAGCGTADLVRGCLAAFPDPVFVSRIR